ncbi:MAG: glycoside hydrolase family 127 protein [Clostridia bacterium]
MMRFLPLSSVTVTDLFWSQVQRLVREVVLPFQWEVLNDRVPGAEPSHCIHNFLVASGAAQGTHEGAVFQDSDLYKWLEAVGYSLTGQPDAKLQAIAEQAISIISAAQEPNGYLNTYYGTHREIPHFYNLTEGHELYCAGHLMEAAVAYTEGTGSDSLLRIALKLAHHLADVFLDEQSRVYGGYPGHPEVEEALIRLYEFTGEERLMELCMAFLNKRGVGESYFDRERARPDHPMVWEGMLRAGNEYFCAHQPVREQRAAAGHAVRAMYLYSAMADAARLTGDAELCAACGALYRNTTQRQMYVTGGIGSAAGGERFTVDDDLPNDSAYAESCASVGLMMFSKRMWLLDDQPERFHTWERALHNTVLAGMGSDGKHFFYVNPLAVDPVVAHVNETYRHVETVRPQWFGVACCPPNLARTLLSLGASLYAADEQSFTVLTHIDSRFQVEGAAGELRHEGNAYCLTLERAACTLRLRIPDGMRMSAATGAARDGYWQIAHQGGHADYRYTLVPETRVLYANTRVAHDEGKLCVMRGSVVYCLEEADNGKRLCELRLPPNAVFTESGMSFLPHGMCALRTDGFRAQSADPQAPFSTQPPTLLPATLTFIPYSQWNNRGEGEMLVWINQA